MPGTRVLNVGQCGVDTVSITRFLSKAVGAEVIGAHSPDEAAEALRGGGFDLVLVNRVFDRGGDSGLDFIRTLKGDPDLAEVPVMLVSNFDDAQREAVDLGALPGFGKAKVGDPEVAEQIRSAIGAQSGA